jgi:ribose transport system substrate-binding protein
MIKKSVCVLLVLVFVFALAACSQTPAPASSEASGSASASTAEAAATSAQESASVAASDSASAANTGSGNYQFALVKGGVNAYFTPMDDAVVKVAQDLGLPAIIMQSPQEWSQNEQNNILDALVAQGVGGIALCTSDPAAGNEEITRIVEAGVPVVTFAMSPSTPSKATMCLATDVKEAAYQGAKNLIESLGGKGKIVHLTGNLTDGNTELRMKGVEAAVSENPGVEILQTITDIDDTEKAQNAIDSLLAAKASEIDGIVCSAYIPSVVLAGRIPNYKDEDIKIVGMDTDEAVLNAIKSGDFAGTMAQNPYGQAYLSICALKLMADGYTWKDSSQFLVDSGTLFINKDNVATYADELTKITEQLQKDLTDKYFTK